MLLQIKETKMGSSSSQDVNSGFPNGNTGVPAYKQPENLVYKDGQWVGANTGQPVGANTTAGTNAAGPLVNAPQGSPMEQAMSYLAKLRGGGMAPAPTQATAQAAAPALSRGVGNGAIASLPKIGSQLGPLLAQALAQRQNGGWDTQTMGPASNGTVA
jgi:hypothetical protein